MVKYIFSSLLSSLPVMCFVILLLKETSDAIPAINTVVQVTKTQVLFNTPISLVPLYTPKHFVSSASVTEAIWLQKALAVALQLQLSQEGELLQQP